MIAVLAKSIANTTPLTTEEEDGFEDISDLFKFMNLSDSAQTDLQKAVVDQGGKLDLLEKGPPDHVPRIRGPASYFLLTKKDGGKFYVTVTDGKPFVVFNAEK